MCNIDKSKKTNLTLSIIVLVAILILVLRFSEEWKFLAAIIAILLGIIPLYLLWIFSNKSQNDAYIPNILIHEGRRLDDKLFIENGLSCPPGYAIRNIDYPKDDIIKPGKYIYHVTCISEISKDGSIQVIPKPIISTPHIKIPMGTELDETLFIKKGVKCSPEECKLKISWSSVDIKRLGDYKYIATAIDQISEFPQSGSITVEKRPPIKLEVPSFSILGGTELSKKLFYEKGGSHSRGCEITPDYSNIKINQQGTYKYSVIAHDGFDSITKEGQITVITANEKFDRAIGLYYEAKLLKDKKKFNDAAKQARKALNIFQQIPGAKVDESASFRLMSDLAEYLGYNYESLLLFIVSNYINQIDNYEDFLREKVSKSGSTDKTIEANIIFAKEQYDKDKGKYLVESLFSKIDAKSVK